MKNIDKDRECRNKKYVEYISAKLPVGYKMITKDNGHHSTNVILHEKCVHRFQMERKALMKRIENNVHLCPHCNPNKREKKEA